jgi:hypothetical protein
MEINLSQEAMIEPAKFGIPLPAILYILYKGITMLSIALGLMYLLEVKSALAPLITPLKFGIQKLANYSQHILAMRDK